MKLFSLHSWSIQGDLEPPFTEADHRASPPWPGCVRVCVLIVFQTQHASLALQDKLQSAISLDTLCSLSIFQGASPRGVDQNASERDWTGLLPIIAALNDDKEITKALSAVVLHQWQSALLFLKKPSQRYSASSSYLSQLLLDKRLVGLFSYLAEVFFNGRGAGPYSESRWNMSLRGWRITTMSSCPPHPMGYRLSWYKVVMLCV